MVLVDLKNSESLIALRSEISLAEKRSGLCGSYPTLSFPTYKSLIYRQGNTKAKGKLQRHSLYLCTIALCNFMNPLCPHTSITLA